VIKIARTTLNSKKIYVADRPKVIYILASSYETVSNIVQTMTLYTRENIVHVVRLL